MASRGSVTAVAVAAALAAVGAGRQAAGADAPAVRTGYAPVNGLRMYYEVHGRPRRDGVPLVLLHGGGSTIETSFGSTLPRLARDREVIAFEQQGHGHTADIADRPFTFEQSTEDTVALLRWLKVPRADFLGYSNGGNIVIELALRHPEVARKLVIVSAMFNRGGCDPAFWEGFNHASLAEMPAELRDAYLRSAPHPEDLPSFFAKSVRRMLDFKGWTAEQVRSIAAPTLVIGGDRDVVRPEHAVEMYRLLPSAELAILPGTDHMAMVNRWEWLVSMVEAFLDAPNPRPAGKR